MEAQRPQSCAEVGEGCRDGARQGVAVEIQRRQRSEIAQFSRDGARQGVAVEGQRRQRSEIA